MKIGFDAKRAFQNRTGLGNYSRYVLRSLCTHYPGNQYIAYAPHPTGEQQMQRLLADHSQLQAQFPPHTLFPSLWRMWGVGRDLLRDKVSVFHGLSGELPLSIKRTGIASVVTIHDLIYLRFPQYYTAIDRRIYAYKMRRACEMADRVVAISECTKHDVMHFFGIPAEKIEVVYQGCDTAFNRIPHPETDERVRECYNLPQHYVLSVGTIEERKNALLLVQALKWLPQEVSLVLVGGRTPYTARVEAAAVKEGVAERLRVLSGVPFSDLPSIYRLATAFAYPSRYEGFGIPVLEALRSGLPTVAATGSCLEEAGGEGALYVNPDDVEAMGDALQRLLSSADLRVQLQEKGQQHLARFNEKEQAAELNRIYQTITQQ